MYEHINTNTQLRSQIVLTNGLINSTQTERFVVVVRSDWSIRDCSGFTGRGRCLTRIEKGELLSQFDRTQVGIGKSDHYNAPAIKH